MRYSSDGSEINVGDRVLIEDKVPGLVVCDFDRWLCLSGYDKWLTREPLADGGTLSTGVMIETQDMGMVHFPSSDEKIRRAP